MSQPVSPSVPTSGRPRVADIPVESVVDVGGVGVVTLRGGSGRQLLVLHDELGFSGWLGWCGDLVAGGRELVVPLQPGFGRTPPVDWFGSVRDVASLYVRMLRESDAFAGSGPIDVVGFSMGGWIAAEMAVMDPGLFGRMVLVGPLGIKPTEGEILDFLALTMRRHVMATVSNGEADEVSVMYGGGISPEQFKLFEAARAEVSRLAWEPFMFDPTLVHRLPALAGGGAGVETMVVWGEDDKVVPRGVVDGYVGAIPGARVEVVAGVGHRPEVEDRGTFVKVLTEFLDTPASSSSSVVG